MLHVGLSQNERRFRNLRLPCNCKSVPVYIPNVPFARQENTRHIPGCRQRRVGVVMGALDDHEWARADDVAAGNERLHKDGHGFRLGVGIHGADDLPDWPVVSEARQYGGQGPIDFAVCSRCRLLLGVRDRFAISFGYGHGL